MIAQGAVHVAVCREHHFERIRNVRRLTTISSEGAEQPHVRQDRFATEAAAFNNLLFDCNCLRHVRLVSRARLGLDSAGALGVLLVSADVRLAGRYLQSHNQS
jgi:hypothetical protein